MGLRHTVLGKRARDLEIIHISLTFSISRTRYNREIWQTSLVVQHLKILKELGFLRFCTTKEICQISLLYHVCENENVSDICIYIYVEVWLYWAI